MRPEASDLIHQVGLGCAINMVSDEPNYEVVHWLPIEQTCREEERLYQLGILGLNGSLLGYYSELQKSWVCVTSKGIVTCSPTHFAEKLKGPTK